jgi:hypothetical protein
MQTTEKGLDMVWNKYDAHLKVHLKPEAHDSLQSAWPARNELQRTPDWNEAEISQKGKKKAPPGEYILPTESAQKTDATFTLPTRKEKPKTRGSATTEPAPAEDQTCALRRAHIIATIHLTKKLYHTFSTLFHQPSTTSQPAEVPWTDFVSAMSTISFLPEKLHGSVWRFTPKDGSTFGTETPINFHEPHPSTKLPFRTARMYGSRLTRHYGLDGDCFVLGG